MGCSSDCCCSEEETNENYHPKVETDENNQKKEFISSQSQRQNTQSNNRYDGNDVNIDQIEIITSQMKKYVCKIYQTEKATATGFMCKIPYQNQLLPVLITNNHILNEEKIKIGKTIQFSFNDKKIEKTIKIDNSRKKYTNPMKDVTVVEIKEEEDKIDDFLDIDDKDNVKYKNKNIYVIQYKLDCKCSYNTGKITNINKGNFNHTGDFNHNCDTDKGSSGSPLLSLENQKVIGLHIGRRNNFRYGIFIKNIIKEFEDNKKFINEKGDYYKGNLLNELKNGIGIIYYYNGDIKFIGNFINDYLEGIIKYMYKNGNNCYNYYIGESKNQLQNGKGIIKDENGSIVYKGFFEEGKIQGFGIYYYEDGCYYEGEWENGLKRGFGIIYYRAGGRKYYGTFKDDKYNGYGIELHENGQCIYKGEYYNNEKHGEGQEFDEKGKSCYKGKYQNGLKNGQGTEYYNDGKRVKYMGNFNNGQYVGKGTYYEEDGTHYEGYFYLGKKHGDGKVYNSNNTWQKDVHFENGKEIKKE